MRRKTKKIARLKGYEDEVDQIFVAAEDGDCLRAWKHFDRAQLTVGDNDSRLTLLHKQLQKSCPAGATRPDENHRMGGLAGLFRVDDLWGLALVVGGLVTAALVFKGKVATETRRAGPSAPFHPDSGNVVFKGRVIP